MKKIGILALQGAVDEHIAKFSLLGTATTAIKNPSQLKTVDGLIIPGGESTVISRLINKNNFYEPLRQFANDGKAVFATCAGLILCASNIVTTHQSDHTITPLNLIDISVKRNSFGRQVNSFETNLSVREIGTNIPAIFIRAPHIKSAASHVDILARYQNRIVMARQGNVLVTSFHPELANDNRVLSYFLSMVNKAVK